MRIALLSDIHGNLVALDAVLARLEVARVDRIVCLGDVAIFGPQPTETLARVRRLQCPVVMGNTDAWALTPAPHPARNEETTYYNAVEAWGAQQLDDGDRGFIRTFEDTLDLSLPDGRLLRCYHGSPASYHEAILATTAEETLNRHFADPRLVVAAGGHTHIAMIRRHRHLLVVNPGSVGLPYEKSADGKRDRNPGWAEYALVDASADELHVTLHRTPIDVDRLLSVAQKSGMPHVRWWSRDWG